MIYTHNGNVVGSSPFRSTMKDISEPRIEVDDEGAEFIAKHNGQCFEIWNTLSDIQKIQYNALHDKVEQVCSVCFELFTKYYKDLEFYALMYRNIPLYRLSLDAYSMMFFASRKNEIIGYHAHIIRARSPKAQIAKLYYDNKALFPKACKKHLDIDLFDVTSDKVTFTEDVILNFKNNTIPQVRSIDNLSSSECQAILENKRLILSDYGHLVGQAPWMYDCLPYQVDFRQILPDSIFPHKELITKFFNERGKASFSRDIDSIEKNDNAFLNAIYNELCPLIKKAYSYSLPCNDITGLNPFEKKKEEVPSKNWFSITTSAESAVNHLEKAKYTDGPSFNSESFGYAYTDKERIEDYENWIFRYEHYPETRGDMALTPGSGIHFSGPRWSNRSIVSPLEFQQKQEYLKQVNEAYIKNKATLQQLRDSERQRREMEANMRADIRAERIKEIEPLQKEIQNVLEKIENHKKEISGLLEATVTVIRNNNDALNIELNRSYEKQYDELWLTKQDFIRKLEASRPYYDSFISLFKRQKLILRNIERGNIITKEHLMGFSGSKIFNDWYEPIKKEKERLAHMEQLRREEEQKREQERLRLEREKMEREEEARRAQYRYNERNAHHRDGLLHFDMDSHTYMVNGKTLESVTTLVSNSFPKFNSEEHARHTAARNGMTVREVIDMWEDKGRKSREQGTQLHEKIEKYYQGIDSPSDPTFELFKQFAGKITLKPYRTEWGVYDFDLGIAGSIDFVDFQNGEYSIYDWKRSEKLIANGLPAKISQYGEKGNYPLGHLDNTPYYHYALQLSLYRYILERNYGIKVTHLRLGIFHPSYTKPYLLEMPYLENEVNDIFNLRSEIIL